jgi:predicted secreted Zn-dependent protease
MRKMKKRANKRSWPVFAVITALAFAMSTAHAESPKIAYYDVAGSNAETLGQQIKTKGPLDGHHRFAAHTDWHVEWTYRYRPTSSGCELTSVSVSLSGTILLPRWIHGSDAPDALVEKWDRYLAALRLHENGHYAHGMSAAKEIEAMAKSFHGSGDCPAVVSEFNDRAHSIIDKYKALDAAYDRETDHGRTQGAQFP